MCVCVCVCVCACVCVHVCVCVVCISMLMFIIIWVYVLRWCASGMERYHHILCNFTSPCNSACNVRNRNELIHIFYFFIVVAFLDTLGTSTPSLHCCTCSVHRVACQFISLAIPLTPATSLFLLHPPGVLHATHGDHQCQRRQQANQGGDIWTRDLHTSIQH